MPYSISIVQSQTGFSSNPQADQTVWGFLSIRLYNGIMEKVNLHQKFGLFHELWHPKIAGELNGSYVKLAKLKGEFVWHQHAQEDELFLVIKGTLTIKLREGDITLREGEFLIVPKGVEHCPVAEEEAHVLLLEPASTVNTGDAGGERTAASEWI